MFKNHLAMIGYNETPNKKAKFWQAYIRSLKGERLYWTLWLDVCLNLWFFYALGSEDIRAHEGRDDFRTPFTIYDEPSTAAGRITVPGYRYLPVHRETYGYSPRAIYGRPSSRPRKLFHRNKHLDKF